MSYIVKTNQLAFLPEEEVEVFYLFEFKPVKPFVCTRHSTSPVFNALPALPVDDYQAICEEEDIEQTAAAVCNWWMDCIRNDSGIQLSPNTVYALGIYNIAKNVPLEIGISPISKVVSNYHIAVRYVNSNVLEFILNKIKPLVDRLSDDN